MLSLSRVHLSNSSSQNQYKRNRAYQQQIAKNNARVKELRKQAISLCNPSETLGEQENCKVIIDELIHTIEKTYELKSSHEKYMNNSFDTEIIEDLKL
jgi:hypothetical protein